MMQKTLDQQTARFAATVLMSLPALSKDTLQRYIEKPNVLKRVLQESLANPMNFFEIWKSVPGGWTITDSLELVKDQIMIPPAVRDIMDTYGNKSTLEPCRVDLARCKVRDLGFSNQVSMCYVYDKMNDLGFACPPIDSWCHVLNSEKLKKGEKLFFPIGQLVGSGFDFIEVKEGMLYVNYSDGHAENADPEDYCVFTAP